MSDNEIEERSSAPWRYNEMMSIALSGRHVNHVR